MKVVAILEADVAWGGGFNQALNAIVQMRDVCRGRFEFAVLTSKKSNLPALRSLDIAAEAFAFSLIDRLLALLNPAPWWHLVQVKLKLKGPFEKKLLRRGCDLVYFLAPSAKTNMLQGLNFITTVWDMCHRDAPEFPEVRESAEFQAREHLYRTSLPAAYAILTDSPTLAEAASRRYGVDLERFLPMPFAPAHFLSGVAPAAKAAVLAKHGLDEGYFFYPAQFWAHKNHIRILQALLLLKASGHAARIAFAGGDQGNRAHVERYAAANGLREQVRFLGFVPAEDMRGLYEGCRAVVMPTYFGPTNIPPLEAWLIGKPLIYSSQFKEQTGDAALCVDPDDARALAEAMRACADAETCARLVKAGTLRLQQIEEQRKTAEAALLARLRQFEARRACWP